VCCADLFIDDVIRIAFIWSLCEVHDEAIKDTLVVSVGLDPKWMIILGYVGVFLMMTVVHDIAENSIAQSGSETYKLTVERVYVAVSAIAGIMVFDGI